MAPDGAPYLPSPLTGEGSGGGEHIAGIPSSSPSPQGGRDFDLPLSAEGARGGNPQNSHCSSRPRCYEALSGLSGQNLPK